MPPLIRRTGGGITGLQLGLVTVIGIIGGIYIWKPVFEKSEYLAAAREEKLKKDE